MVTAPILRTYFFMRSLVGRARRGSETRVGSIEWPWREAAGYIPIKTTRLTPGFWRQERLFFVPDKTMLAVQCGRAPLSTLDVSGNPRSDHGAMVRTSKGQSN